MNALARLSKDLGKTVSGSDRSDSEALRSLKAEGIDAYAGSCPLCAVKADLVVYSSAVKAEDPEREAAEEAGILTLERYAYWGFVSTLFERCVAVSGTHGKTTTTAMLCSILLKADASFTAHIGGKALDIGGGYISRGRDIFLTEACEYRKSFLALKPHLSLILNVEEDHPDCYHSIEELRETFVQLSSRSSLTLTGTCEMKGDFFAGEGGDYQARNIENVCEIYAFDIYKRNRFFTRVELKVTGAYNVQNALCAAAAADILGISAEDIKEGLCAYSGTERRYEYVGRCKGADVYTDYAHHPSEIASVLKAAKCSENKRLVVFFEPHTYSRTKALFNEFTRCFSEADVLAILPVYPARETPSMGIDSKTLCESVREAFYLDSYEAAIDFAKQNVGEGDKILTVGAGSINELAKRLCALSR